ncbi:hypothetical protein FW774_10250 [Pedobacter sp. BS3]|uniref:hypothetical protein n=1 Tax=Pedobacter sp. BS3 TaxID=2567937 RepID=UPI0011EE4F73|nr:hypothetical protein [Pedobacter sp. BS3]TZF83836.1 hypothetical protein FW774_10250 [Pedobacter sp. BS3]
MIAVVYSGSRYANWKLAEKHTLVSEFRTIGINPYFDDEKVITQLLNKNNELITHAEKIKKIYFFGAGITSKEQKSIVSNALEAFFIHSKVVVEPDMKAAALGTCGDSKGIVGILGSGSNAAYYNGKHLKKNNYGLGFILNDEGSSNWIGRKLLKSFLVNEMPAALREKFIYKYNYDRKYILEKVYRNPHPILFLGSFSEFLMDNKKDPFIKQIVSTGFDQYFKNYIIPLSKKHPGNPLHFAGTVAAGFEDWLHETAHKNGMEIQSVVKAPIYNVLNYYINKN